MNIAVNPGRLFSPGSLVCVSLCLLLCVCVSQHGHGTAPVNGFTYSSSSHQWSAYLPWSSCHSSPDCGICLVVTFSFCPFRSCCLLLLGSLFVSQSPIPLSPAPSSLIFFSLHPLCLFCYTPCFIATLACVCSVSANKSC